MLGDAPVLVIDAASPRCFVGVWRAGAWLAAESLDSPALEGIFAGVDGCLSGAGLALEEVAGFVHGEGPGSILGIRLSAMAIRAWRVLPAWRDAPVWSFGSLHWAAAARAAEGFAAPAAVISEFRHGKWNCLRAGASEVVAIDAGELAALPAPLVYVRQRKAWGKPPDHAVEWAPDWRQHAGTLAAPGLLRSVAAPGVFVAEEAEFKKWTPERRLD